MGLKSHLDGKKIFAPRSEERGKELTFGKFKTFQKFHKKTAPCSGTVLIIFLFAVYRSGRFSVPTDVLD